MDPRGSNGLPIAPAFNIRDPLVNHFPPSMQFVDCCLDGGQCYPRMYRDQENPLFREQMEDAWQMSRMAFDNLINDMMALFRQVEPDKRTADTIYGHGIRNLLALACMEVESSCKAVLRANGYKTTPLPNGQPQRLTTKDYVLLLGPLRLDEYEVLLPAFRRIAPFKPFEHWNPASPTESLAWYNAYNSTKHARETRFHEGTLLKMVHALGAAYVMILAQFGECTLDVALENEEFFPKTRPLWTPAERYVPPSVVGADTWTEVPYTF